MAENLSVSYGCKALELIVILFATGPLLSDYPERILRRLNADPPPTLAALTAFVTVLGRLLFERALS